MINRLILPDWALAEYPTRRKVLEGVFTPAEIKDLNSQFYNIYYLPNSPSEYTQGVTVDGSHIDTFEWVFVDMDLKDGKHTKESFLERVFQATKLNPTKVVDSGNGVHVYWAVSDLTAMSFLRLQRRLCRFFDTDEAVSKIYQLMRLPGTINTKHKAAPKPCDEIYTSGATYTCEQLDAELDAITLEDEEYCQAHYNKTYEINSPISVDTTIPIKFNKLLLSSKEAKEIWNGNTDDRSKADYRLGHLMFANDFTKEEALSVLVNSAKALSRAPVHRINYAKDIVDKIWVYELAEGTEALNLSQSVKDILQQRGGNMKGTRFPCDALIDDTEYGFHLGQVIGLVAGSGVGKTSLALNMFRWFVKNNPDYVHMFIPLEQKVEEIADRWRTLCQGDTSLHDKVHIMSNYAPDGSFRHLSFDDIKEYILRFQKTTGKKMGCIVIDHIGALKKKNNKTGENQDLMDICHAMKGFAVETNTMLVMQSQAPREKAGIGDLELNKDAAYGTVYFESYCDYLITLWQPLKRCYSNPKCPTTMAVKFAKIRHKKQGVDRIQEDVCYNLRFDPITERLRAMTQDDYTSFKFFLNQATNIRKQDRKTDLVTYVNAGWEEDHAKT